MQSSGAFEDITVNRIQGVVHVSHAAGAEVIGAAQILPMHGRADLRWPTSTCLVLIGQYAFDFMEVL